MDNYAPSALNYDNDRFCKVFTRLHIEYASLCLAPTVNDIFRTFYHSVS